MPPETKPMSSWMVVDKEYPVFDVLKYRLKQEDGSYRIFTLFLVADSVTGRLDWIDGSIVLYCGEGNESKSIRDTEKELAR